MTPDELFQPFEEWSPERKARAEAHTKALKAQLAATWCHPCARCGLKYTTPARAKRCRCQKGA